MERDKKRSGRQKKKVRGKEINKKKPKVRVREAKKYKERG